MVQNTLCTPSGRKVLMIYVHIQQTQGYICPMYLCMHARTHVRTYVQSYASRYFCMHLYIYIHTLIYVTLISPQWVPMTTTSGSPGVWMDQTPGSPRALRALSWWPLQYIRLTYSNTQKGRKVKSYEFTQWLLFYLVGGCDNWSCEWIWVVFLSLAGCGYSFQHWRKQRHLGKQQKYQPTKIDGIHHGYQPTKSIQIN